MNTQFQQSGGHHSVEGDRLAIDDTQLYLNTPVPEPTSLALFGLGAATLAVVRRRRRRC